MTCVRECLDADAGAVLLDERRRKRRKENEKKTMFAECPRSGTRQILVCRVSDRDTWQSQIWRVPDQGTRQTLFFFHFPSFFSFFSITCFSKFVPMNFKNTLSNSLNNIYLIFLRMLFHYVILFYYLNHLQFKFDLYQKFL